MRFAMILLLMLSLAVPGQNCANTSVGLVPLIDLGVGTYGGYQGGLYPGGSNQAPPAHHARALAAAQAIAPRSPVGAPDPDGKIVLLSIGMSNTSQEFATFQSVSDADPQRSGSVVVVDGAQGGQHAGVISDPSANFWTVVDQRLAAANVTAAQVQAVWLKQALAGPTGAFPAAEILLQSHLAAIAAILHDRYPNLRLTFVSSRTYGGYASGTLNPEPYAYGSGFSVQWLIGEQIVGNPALNPDPSAGPVEAPLLVAGPYLWADGTTPRSDGFTWNCADVAPDGTHPSASGRTKVADLLSQHLHASPYAAPWYLGTPSPGASRTLYGVGCGGTNGIPTVQSNSPPFLGNPAFSLGVSGAVANAPATLVVSLAAADLPIGSCRVLVDLDPNSLILPAPGLPATLLTNGGGAGFFTFAIPNDPALDQLDLFAQWAILDPNGQLPTTPTFALTRGLHLHFGPAQ